MFSVSVRVRGREPARVCPAGGRARFRPKTRNHPPATTELPASPCAQYMSGEPQTNGFVTPVTATLYAARGRVAGTTTLMALAVMCSWGPGDTHAEFLVPGSAVNVTDAAVWTPEAPMVRVLFGAAQEHQNSPAFDSAASMATSDAIKQRSRTSIVVNAPIDTISTYVQVNVQGARIYA